jgi:di/tricarboxylate transporter
LIKNLAGSGLVFTIAILVLGVFGILTPSEMISGFSNEQIAVIVMLLIVGDIMKKSNFIEMLFFKAFQGAKTYRSFMGRMALMTAGLSAFLNNTPLVAVMMPFVHMWSKKNGVAPSKLLIPLSYAAILGGCVTLIGTSTNLIVNGLVADQHIIPGLKTLQIFDFTPVGLTMAVIGMVYLLLFAKKLLPNNKDFFEKMDANNREYFAEIRVANNATINGKTVEEAGLRNLKGLFLVELHRNGHVFSPVTPQTKVYSRDILLFAGNTETISEMMDVQKDLQLAQAGMYTKMKHTEMIEVVVSYNSVMASKTAKEFNFRGKYDAAIIAIHRNGEKISGKIGEVKLQPGDVLMLIAGDDFNKRAQDNRDFYVISKIKEFNNVSWWKSFLFIGGLLAAIITSALGLIPLFTALLLLIVFLNVAGLSSPKEIAKGIDFNLVFVIALSLALGTAMVKTGIAHTFANASFQFLEPLGIVGLFAGIFLFTNLLAAVVTNKAAVALVFPIVLTMAIELNLNPKPFILLIAFAGAASFITPIGYQTNLMVYGPGGYNFKDFIKIGAPLTILYMIATVLILILQFDLSIY